MQEGYQWKMDKLLFTCMPHANIQISWLDNGLPFLIRTVLCVGEGRRKEDGIMKGLDGLKKKSCQIH